MGARDVRQHGRAGPQHGVGSSPTHTDCPPINQVGFLNPGESRTTGTLNVPRTCGFHDHLNETDPTYMGKIVIVE